MIRKRRWGSLLSEFRKTLFRGAATAALWLWTLNPASLTAANPAAVSLKVRIDILAPDAVSDLVVQKATGTEGSLILNWTEPGDDGMTGSAASYHVRYSTSGNIENLSDFDSSTVTVYNSGWLPGTGGSARVQTVDNLIPGQTYYWAIRAQDSASLKGYWSRNSVNLSNFAVADDEPPAPVAGVTALPGNSIISLTWTDLSAAQKTSDFDFYRIYRSTYSDFSYQASITTTSSVNFNDTAVTNGTTYYYRVLGVDKGLTSNPPYYGSALESLSWSTVTTHPRLVLLPPSNLQAVSISTRAIVWSWQDNSSNEDGFNVYTTTGGLLSQLGADTTYYLWSGLSANTSYGFTVNAFNGDGPSTGSLTSVRYTLAQQPILLQASTATTSTVSLTWNGNGNPGGTRYILERATDPVPPNPTVQIADTTLTTLVSSGLAEATTYLYQLTARNGDGTDTAVTQISTATLKVKPGAINTLTVVQGPSQGSALLGWIAPGNDGATGNIAGGEYDVRWSTNAFNTEAEFQAIPNTPAYRKVVSTDTAAGSSQGLLITGLPFATSVYFGIKTRDQVPGNYSDLSNVAGNGVQTDVSSPSAVTSLRATLLSNTSARLTWIAPGDDGNENNNLFGAYDIRTATGPITSLAQFLQASSASDFGSIPAPSVVNTQEQMTLNGLSLDTTYYVRLRARDEAQNVSPLSNGATIYTPDTLAPDPVQNFTATANKLAGRRIDLSWKNPTTYDLRGVRIVVSTLTYQMQPSTQALAYFDLTGSSLPSSYAHTDLAPGVTYYYSIFAFDDEATPNFSSGLTASTVPVRTVLAPPERPGRARGTLSANGAAFTLYWDSPTYRTDGSLIEPAELSSYKIFRMGLVTGATNQIFIHPVSSPTVYLDAGAANHIYYYKLRAVNVAGDESQDSDVIGVPEERQAGRETLGDVYVMMDDNLSYIKVTGEYMGELYDQSMHLSGRRITAEEGGKVFKAVDVKVNDDRTGQTRRNYVFDKPVQVSIGYFVSSDGKIANGSPALAFERALPSAQDAPRALSIYWYNGSQWIKLGTQVDPAQSQARVQTRHSGAFQIRLVQQADIQSNTVFPKTITPNGDGINDMVFFFFENKTGAPVQGKIYDLRSMKVADVQTSDVFAGENSVLTWDGKDGSGSVVPGGAYLYKIEVGGQTYTGTIAVAR